jgi:phosphoribosylformylglycinamidine synthase I
MSNPKVLVLRTAGTNCDQETAFAFKESGAVTELVHINSLLEGKTDLKNYHILAVPGGFTYGDDIESGRILANELRFKLAQPLQKFVQDGKLIIGICNGFQILTKAGILPGPLKDNDKGNIQKTTLTNNDSGKFEDRWIHLKVSQNSVWTKGVKEVVYLPVAHAEGKFIPIDEQVLNSLKDNGQIALRYVSPQGQHPKYPENPNGSVENIAGITDKTGRILGLMPHPERHFLFAQHPSWTRLKKNGEYGDGAKIFQNGVDYVKKNLMRA